VPTSSVVGRVAAVLALIGAAVVVLLLLVGGGSSYTVTAQFENASQLVKGNLVNVAGVRVGTISEIALSDDGQALVKMEVSDESYTPLPAGTKATIRSQSLSGIANRYVDLDLPPASSDTPAAGSDPPAESGDSIPSGGTISQVDTTSEVDLDQLFNTLDKPTVEHLKEVIRGFARAYDGVGPQANRGFHYLNPFLSTSRRVFGELNSDQAHLDSLVVDAASLTSALDERSPEISSLISNLNGMLGTIGRHESSLSSAVGQLPDFMRQFDTTAVNLRAALDDVDPLIRATRPVARKLKPFTKRLRYFARDAVPTVTNLDQIVKAPGPANDLIELTALQDPLAEIGVGPVDRNGKSRPGSLPESAQSLADSLPQIQMLRAYSPELIGWFDDFGHSGFPDALGGIGRISATLNAFSVGAPASPCNPVLHAVNEALPAAQQLSDALAPACDALSGSDLADELNLHDTKRCPGANERANPGETVQGGDGPYDPGTYEYRLTLGNTVDCDATQQPVGP
jgi:phospholipid/cholesterol/gamma-HCH transport system substrate-binding protein